MSYKIVIDSCGELLEQWKQDERFESVPLTLTVGSENIIDDETFDQADFLQKVAACPECPKSACPSPESYRKAFDCEADHVYCVTLSSELSGSYNSAVLGASLLHEERKDKQVHVFNSRSASKQRHLLKALICQSGESNTDQSKGLPLPEFQKQSSGIFVDLIGHVRGTGKAGLMGTVLEVQGTEGDGNTAAFLPFPPHAGSNNGELRQKKGMCARKAIGCRSGTQRMR